jgi:hypothetical protein
MNPSALFRFALPATCMLAGMVLGVAGMAAFPASRGAHAPAVREAAPIAPRLSWKDLADADPGRFAVKLRAFGCPEDTISRILAHAEAAPVVVEAVPTPAVATPVPVAMPTVAPTPAPAAPAAPTFAYGAVPPDVVIVAPQGCVPLPVAFQEMPQDARMTVAQRIKLDAIQQEFIAAIGGPNQDPASEEYLNRWRQAQPKCDAAFKAAFGPTAFMRRYMATVQPRRPEGAPGS